MKKQFLENLSSDFPNALNCSSIRMNAEQQQSAPIRRSEKSSNQQLAAPKNKKFQQHSIVGFEMSLSMSGNRENILQLMRSKSANTQAQPKTSKLQVHQKKQEQVSFNGGSLYNTTSFEEVTMNITSNTKHNNTHLHTKMWDGDDENGFSRTFKKPQGFTAFKESYDEDKLTICINKDSNKNNIKIEGDLKHSNAELLEGLKCSGVEKQQEVSYQQPYFKAVLMNPEKLDRKKTADFPNRFMNDNRRQTKKMTSVQGMNSTEKKFTLRDYMYLSKLSGKPKDRESILSGPHSPKFSRQTLGVSRSKRKINLNNVQVMDRLKEQVSKQIRLVQGNLNLLLQYIDSCEYENEVSHEQLMKMYNIARIVKDKIVVGNDQLVLNLQNINNQ